MLTLKRNGIKYRDAEGNMQETDMLFVKTKTDSTFTKHGVPADAKATGDTFAKVHQQISDLPNDENLIYNVAESLKTKVPLVKTAEQPNFANSVKEMTDTSKVYVMPDGYFYGYREIENYNLFKISEVLLSTRLQDDVAGTTSSTIQNFVTGWIPVEYGKYYSTSILWNEVRETSRVGYQRMNLKRADGSIVVYNKQNVPQVIAASKRVIDIEYEDAVAIQLHLCITDEGNTLQDIESLSALRAFGLMIVEGDTPEGAYYNVMNLEYIDGEAETVAEWYNTGLVYNQPVDYEGRVIKLESGVSKLQEGTKELEANMKELEANMTNPASTSPYYRNVNYGVIPFTYYQGVAPVYEKIFRQGELYADFISAWKTLVANHSGYVTETELGSASDGQKIYMYDFKPVRVSNEKKDIPKIIIIAGQHGFEKSNIYGLYYFIDNMLNRWDKHPTLEYLRNHVELMIIPVLNPHGFDTLEYKNANGVNLNRNFDSHWELIDDTTSSQYGGAEPFDQPETQFVRDLVMNNKDASLVVDFHTNGSLSVETYEDITWYGVCKSTDDYYNRMLDAVSHHLSNVTAHFNLDYELNQPNTMLGFLHNNDGTGLLRNWAVDNNFVGVLIEGFNGFPNEERYTGRVYKANEELIVNYLITLMNYLSK